MTNERPWDLARVAEVSDRTWKLAEESHKPIIRRFEKHKVRSSFKDKIWGADLADIQLISKCNKRF